MSIRYLPLYVPQDAVVPVDTIFIGAEVIAAIFAGSIEIAEVYVGTVKVWPLES